MRKNYEGWNLHWSYVFSEKKEFVWTCGAGGRVDEVEEGGREWKNEGDSGRRWKHNWVLKVGLGKKWR